MMNVDIKEIHLLLQYIIFLVELAGKIYGMLCFCIFAFTPTRILLKANLYIRGMLVVGAWGFLLAQLFSDLQSVVSWMMTIIFALWFFCTLDWEEYVS